MFIDTCNTGKYVRHLLRESFRENGKVKHRSIANLSACSPQEIEAMKLALKHKNDLSQLIVPSKDVRQKQGPSVGAVFLLQDIAKQIGITKALGNTRNGKLALWQVMARLINQGSRLSAVRLAASHAACDILNTTPFDEDDLYENLDWLCENQDKIEDRLVKQMYPDQSPDLYLYDVTSSYLEGTDNQLGAFGYNRDGKKGKRQIVIGLLCDQQGRPLSIEVFKGNTKDTSTFANQVRKASDRFGGGEVVFVGDRGMIKSPQMEQLGDFHYITAITKPQIQKLVSDEVIDMGLFDKNLAEVLSDDGKRYILRCNPVRASEIRYNRQERVVALNKRIEKKNQYLKEHKRASVQTALRDISSYCDKLKLSDFITIQADSDNRCISSSIDQDKRDEAQKLDGCYVITTSLSQKQASKETVHQRYKDLAKVEKAFRVSKTVELEMRPIHVRLETRTRGHALVVMLAYRIAQELAARWRDVDKTVQEAIDDLGTVCATEVLIRNKVACNQVPTPRDDIVELLNLADVRLPEVFRCTKGDVSTNRKLPERRVK
jgi:transposase